MNYSLQTLSNGLRLLTVPMPSLESMCLTVWVRVGSRFEDEKIAGISHFLEHMTFKGSKKYQTAQKVSETLDALGAEYNAATSNEWTNFYIKVRVGQMEKAFDVLSDMLLHPRFLPEDIERERGVILEELSMSEDVPMSKVGDIFMEKMFEGNPLNRDIIGTKESVNAINQKNFIDFRNEYYTANNMLITVSGGVEEKEAVALCEKYFGSLPQGSLTNFLSFVPAQSAPKLVMKKKETEQAHIIVGFLGYQRGHERRFAENILATILGRGMSSRLFLEVREKRGLAYSVGSSLSRFIDVGVFDTYAGVDPSKTPEAIKVILNEHYKLINEKAMVTNEELAKAKEYIKGRTALALEDSSAVNDYYGQRALFLSDIETPEDVFEKIDAVTEAEILAVAREIFVPERLTLAVIGPFEDTEKFEKLIQK